MAWLTQSYQIASVVCATFGKRNLMMDFLSWYHPTLLETHFTQRVLLYIAVPYALPGSSIPTAYSRVTVVLLVALVLLTLVFLAESSLCKVGTSGVGTGALGFLGHFLTSFWAEEKPHRIAPVRLSSIHFG